MEFYEEKIYHIYNRGNNREKIFYERKNYLFFLRKMKSHLLKHCNVLAWCLMPNHFHWMVQIHDNYESEIDTVSPDTLSPIIPPMNRTISTILSSYTKAINKMYNRSGSLFQPRTKSKELSPDEWQNDNYPLICFLYIHQNPMKAGLVDHLEDWEFSSYMDYAGLRKGSLCNKELAMKLLELPDNHLEFTKFSYRTIPDHVLKKII